LLTIPMMFGSFLGSVGSGQLITRTGKWKRYLVLGGLFLTAGLGLLGTIDHTSPYWYVGSGMLAMGIGMGMMMQNLVLAVQNTVDVSQVGAASASVTFFRSLGGAVGVSVLGAVLANRVTDLITANLRALGISPVQGGSGGSVLDVGALPAPVAEIVRHAYGDATGKIFIIAAGSAVVSLLAVLFIREVPLRRTVGITEAVEPSAESPVDGPAESAAVMALDVITAAERTAREREREASERVQAAANVIRQMRTDVADLFTRVDQQIGALEESLPNANVPRPAAAILDSQRPAGELVDELRRYELSVLSASQRTADHLRETAQVDADHLRDGARADADHLLAEARAEEQEIRRRIAELEAVEHRLLGTIRDGLSDTPPPPASPAANGYPEPDRQPFG
jgi:hypothetical protein